MPELPEVETVARGLRARILGRTIKAVAVTDPKLAQLSNRESPRGREIAFVRRRGKFLALGLNSGQVLLLHMMMSGRLLARRPADPPDAYLRLTLRLGADLEIRFCDPRRFGSARLLERGEYAEFSRRMGAEPLTRGFTADLLVERLAGRKAAVKTVLMNQKLIAGVGNIYADEALWRARINPACPAGRLDLKAAGALHRALRAVLRKGLAAGGTTFERYADAEGRPGQNQNNLRAFRKTGQPCARCRTPIAKTIVGGRSTHFCPKCQA